MDPAIIIGILIALLGIAIYIIQNLYKKIQMHEAHALNLNASLLKILKTLRKIDQKEMFEKDDEVGLLWEQIKAALIELEAYILD
ncbi:MAG: hypothetical protein HQ541_23435 [Mariniphaga sp.]|nr:hypothetical protein [Mariniphaga sp.]